MAAAAQPAVCAVIVTFHPDERFPDRLAAIADQAAHTVIVDNGSAPASLERLRLATRDRPASLLENGRNLGLGAALNQGLRTARDLGFLWAVTYDQDSRPAPGMVATLQEAIAAAPAPGRVACAGPRIAEENIPADHHRWIRPRPGFPLLFQRFDPPAPAAATFVITSGCLTSLALAPFPDPFREDFFIDYLDHDFCLRARRNLLNVLAVPGARLFHNLGAKTEIDIGGRTVRPTNHGANRLYYIHRNRWSLLRRYALSEPHWAAFDCTFNVLNLVRVALFEKDRPAKLRAVFDAHVDALRGRLGPRPSRPPAR